MDNRTQITHEGITAEFFQTSREWCQRTLSRLPDIQRSLNRARVQSLVLDLNAGEWKPIYDPFRLSSEGLLIDGQHRVNAFLEADFYPTILLLKGFSLSLYPDIGVEGLPKSKGEAFRQLGINNYCAASSISGYVSLYLRGGSLAKYTSYSQTLETYLDHQTLIQDSIHAFTPIESILSRTRKGTLMVLGSKFYGENFTQKFFSEFQSGIGSPGATLLRKAMVANANKTRGKFSTAESLALGIKAMRADYTGQDIRQLKWTKEEKFPRLEEAMQPEHCDN